MEESGVMLALPPALLPPPPSSFTDRKLKEVHSRLHRRPSQYTAEFKEMEGGELLAAGSITTDGEIDPLLNVKAKSGKVIAVTLICNLHT